MWSPKDSTCQNAKRPDGAPDRRNNVNAIVTNAAISTHVTEWAS
jgi:hypothetical protein